MSAHTPGPWQVVLSQRGYPYKIRTKSGITDITRWAAISQPSSVNGRANAELMAAAPDLLAAAQAVRETCPCDPDINPRWNAAWDALMAAIIKAEGR